MMFSTAANSASGRKSASGTQLRRVSKSNSCERTVGQIIQSVRRISRASAAIRNGWATSATCENATGKLRVRNGAKLCRDRLRAQHAREQIILAGRFHRQRFGDDGPNFNPNGVTLLADVGGVLAFSAKISRPVFVPELPQAGALREDGKLRQHARLASGAGPERGEEQGVIARRFFLRHCQSAVRLTKPDQRERDGAGNDRRLRCQVLIDRRKCRRALSRHHRLCRRLLSARSRPANRS